MKLFKHFLIMALALTACAGFTSCKDDDDEDSQRPLTGYWVSEGEHEDFFYYIHPNGCGFCGYLNKNPPEIYDVFESYVITKDDELIIYWLDDDDFSTDPDNKGKISIGKDSFTTKYGNFVKKGKDYPYTLNFQTNDKIANWWNEHTK